MRKLFLFIAALTLCAGLWAENIPNNQLWYTTTDSNIVKPKGSYLFNVTVQSNTYENGKGVITFDGDLVKIGQGVFSTIPTLESVTLPASLRTIGNVAFGKCTGLTTVNLNAGLDTIALSAFSGCTALTEISIPASVRALINSCFHNCEKLTQIHVNWTEANQIPVEYSNGIIPEDTPVVHDNVFSEIACQEENICGRKYATLHVPAGTENLYCKSAGWNEFGTIQENLTDVKPAAIEAINNAKEGVTNAHIIAIANDAIAAINAASNSFHIEGIKTQALADIAHAKAILNDLPTDPDGTTGQAVVVTKDEKSITLINPDKVSYIQVKNEE